jgi:hypothetical protein
MPLRWWPVARVRLPTGPGPRIGNSSGVAGRKPHQVSSSYEATELGQERDRMVKSWVTPQRCCGEQSPHPDWWPPAQCGHPGGARCKLIRQTALAAGAGGCRGQRVPGGWPSPLFLGNTGRGSSSWAQAPVASTTMIGAKVARLGGTTPALLDPGAAVGRSPQRPRGAQRPDPLTAARRAFTSRRLSTCPSSGYQ